MDLKNLMATWKEYQKWLKDQGINSSNIQEKLPEFVENLKQDPEKLQQLKGILNDKSLLCAKDEGHSDIANYFFMRTKTRVQMMNEDHQKMEELIKKEEMESGKPYEEGKWDCMHEYFMEEKEELEYAVQNFKM